MDKKHLCFDVTDIRDDKTWTKWVKYPPSPCLHVLYIPAYGWSISWNGYSITVNASLCCLLVSRGMLIFDLFLLAVELARMDWDEENTYLPSAESLSSCPIQLVKNAE